MGLFTGKTVEEAIENGLQELGISRMKAHIKVMAREKKGFFGFGKKPAQVEVTAISQQTAHKANQKAVQGVPDYINRQNEAVSSREEDAIAFNRQAKEAKQLASQSASRQADTTQPEPAPAAPVAPEQATSQPAKQTFDDFVASEFDSVDDSKEIQTASQEVTAYVEKIIYEMDLEATIETSYNRRQISLQIETPEAGRVIGYHGKVLKSLQLLAQNYLHDRYAKHFSVSLNVHDYVEHRTETLIDFSKKIAERVLETGQDFRMDPMSNSERKVVHKTLTAIEGIDSYSEGDDPDRYVVVRLRD